MTKNPARVADRKIRITLRGHIVSNPISKPSVCVWTTPEFQCFTEKEREGGVSIFIGGIFFSNFVVNGNMVMVGEYG